METLPFRFSYWNIPVPLRVLFFITMAIAVVLLIYGTVQRVRLWRKGQPEVGFNRPWLRLKRVLRYAVAQVRILRQRYPAAMHLGIFWGMVLLFIGTVLGTLDTDVFELFFNAKLLQGDFYLLYKVVLDLAGLFVLVGLGLAVYRRYIVKPDRLNTDWRFNLTLPLLALIILTGFLIEALRLAAMQPFWAPFSVVGYPISLLFQELPESTLLALHRGTWITHYLIVAVGIATVPWTNLFHILSSPANIFVAPFKTPGALKANREPRTDGDARRQQARRVPLAPAGQRGRMHRMRTLPGGLSGVCRAAAAQPEEAGAGFARRADSVAGGRTGEWENGRTGEWGKGRLSHSPTLPLPHSPRRRRHPTRDTLELHHMLRVRLRMPGADRTGR